MLKIVSGGIFHLPVHSLYTHSSLSPSQFSSFTFFHTHSLSSFLPFSPSNSIFVYPVRFFTLLFLLSHSPILSFLPSFLFLSSLPTFSTNFFCTLLRAASVNLYVSWRIHPEVRFRGDELTNPRRIKGSEGGPTRPPGMRQIFPSCDTKRDIRRGSLVAWSEKQDSGS